MKTQVRVGLGLLPTAAAGGFARHRSRFCHTEELMAQSQTDDVPSAQSEFTATHWSMVLAAKDGSVAEAAAALDKLCRAYWYPLYAFLRREGRSPHDAEDLTQGFFVQLLQRNFLENVSADKGRFRSFMLAALKHFVCDVWDKGKAAKRGGGQILISLGDLNPEDLYLLEPDTTAPAEKIFEQRWAVTLLGQALARLREEFIATGKVAEFEQLKVFLSTPTTDGAYDIVASKLQLAADTVAVKVHRLRQRYGELIRAEVAQTVANSADVEEELRHLFEAVGH
jgi:DNA-directed RNA polymerase specialized sigma24 family protein